jgi:hypothetical protein
MMLERTQKKRISARAAIKQSFSTPMMGERRVMQEALFYGFSLERHVPDNHCCATRLRHMRRRAQTDRPNRRRNRYRSRRGEGSSTQFANSGRSLTAR